MQLANSTPIGHFKLLTKVGTGSFAESVIKAVDSRTNEVVALKVFRQGLEMQRAQDEHNVLASLRETPNIVQLKDSIYLPEKMELVLAMEYMDYDLAALIEDKNVTFSLSECKYIFQQVLRGLVALKKRNIMHRDIKAANILVNKKGQVKIGDLGSATNFAKRPTFSPHVCTLHSRAPELLLGVHKYNDKVDIWSAACVFVELMTKLHFIRGDNEREQLASIIKFFGTPNINVIRDALPADHGADAIMREMPHVPAQYPAPYLVKAFGDVGAQMMHSMFSFDPRARPSAETLLMHEFFSMSPLPAISLNTVALPTELHEYDVRMMRGQRNQHHRHADMRYMSRPSNGQANGVAAPPAVHNLLVQSGMSYLSSIPPAASSNRQMAPRRGVLKKVEDAPATGSDVITPQKKPSRHITLSLVHQERLYDPKSSIYSEVDNDELVNEEQGADIVADRKRKRPRSEVAEVGADTEEALDAPSAKVPKSNEEEQQCGGGVAQSGKLVIRFARNGGVNSQHWRASSAGGSSPFPQ